MQRTTVTHEHCWDEIPWLVNGRLSDAEREVVTAHAATCAECREELARQRELHAHMRGTDEAAAVPHAAWNKLLARIDAQSPSPHALDVQARVSSSRNRWLIAAVWTQGIALAVLLAALLVPNRPLPAEYFTLSTPDQAVQRASIRVVFAPTASLEQINRLLRDIEGNVIAGPSEAGVYTVAIAAADSSVAIGTLRRHADVLFAESGMATSGRE